MEYLIYYLAIGFAFDVILSLHTTYRGTKHLSLGARAWLYLGWPLVFTIAIAQIISRGK
jgi:hypothetical protein